MSTLQIERLKELFDYDPETGLFKRRIRRAGHLVGSIAGHCDDGYIRIEIDGKNYRANRLAWFYMTGEWPSGKIDHRNGVTDDNRWENLRDATDSQNAANSSMNIRNKSGYKGISETCVGTYRADIMVKGRRIYLGTKPTAEEAHALYCDAARAHFGEFARFG